MKICPRCKIRERNGRRAYCKECEKGYDIEYKQKNKEIISKQNKERYLIQRKDKIEYQKKYYQEHKDNSEFRLKRKLRGKLWREKNPETQKNYREKNKKRIKELNKRWVIKNKEKVKIIQKRYQEKYPDRCKKSRRKYYFKNQEIKIEKSKEYHKKHPEKRRIIQRKYAKKHPKKIKAHFTARKIKIPENQLCQICNKNLATEKHHPDYNKPLEVQFLCNKCHNKIHLT